MLVDKNKSKKKGNRCFVCGAEVVWQNDFNFEDYCLDGDGIVSVYKCMECDADYDVYINIDETDEVENDF